MSEAYKGQDPIKIAHEAEKDLNSHAAKHGHDADRSAQHGHGASDSSTYFDRESLAACAPLRLTFTSAAESGIDQSVIGKFPGATATAGSSASGAGDNREIPVEEGGGIQRGTGK